MGVLLAAMNIMTGLFFMARMSIVNFLSDLNSPLKKLHIDN
jgi:hypothetical protein